MRLRPTTLAPPAETAQQLDPLLHCRILVETAMEQAQCAGADAALISRQLAGELRKCKAALSELSNTNTRCCSAKDRERCGLGRTLGAAGTGGLR